MTTIPVTPNLEAYVQRLPLFDGFPYLITRLVGALRHVTPLPADRSEKGLRRLAELQVLANRLETCLVLAADRAVFYNVDAESSQVEAAPRGGVFIEGKLRPAEAFPPTPELRARTARLRAFIDSLEQTGYSTGDSQSAYRPATEEEIALLSDCRADGELAGLDSCVACGDFRGECLGAAPNFDRSITRVYCRCENHNRCAQCGNPLAERRLNANYFNRDNRRLLFEPAFCGLSHVCPESLRRIQ